MDTCMIIRSFLERYINIDEVNQDTNLYEDGLVNSLFAMQLILFLEDKFQFQIHNEEIQIENFSSWRAIDTFVQAKLATHK